MRCMLACGRMAQLTAAFTVLCVQELIQTLTTMGCAMRTMVKLAQLLCAVRDPIDEDTINAMVTPASPAAT